MTYCASIRETDVSRNINFADGGIRCQITLGCDNRWPCVYLKSLIPLRQCKIVPFLSLLLTPTCKSLSPPRARHIRPHHLLPNGPSRKKASLPNRPGWSWGRWWGWDRHGHSRHSRRPLVTQMVITLVVTRARLFSRTRPLVLALWCRWLVSNVKSKRTSRKRPMISSLFLYYCVSFCISLWTYRVDLYTLLRTYRGFFFGVYRVLTNLSNLVTIISILHLILK
jgi:hypothetical protein